MVKRRQATVSLLPGKAGQVQSILIQVAASPLYNVSRWRKQLIRRGWGMGLFCIGSDKLIFIMTPQSTQGRTQSTQGPIVSFVPFLVPFVVKKNLAIQKILFLIMIL